MREAGPVGQPHCQRKDKRGCQAGRVRGTLDKMRNDFLPGGRSCVLVVEDDPAIRLMAVDILSDAGFETLEAGDAAQALEALNKSEHKIDVLFTDLRMPGMNGLELAHVAKRKHPQLRVIVTSGDYEKDLPPGAKFLAKPWCASDLLRVAS